MISVITAIGNPIICEKLKNEKNIKIIGKDIFYEEAIYEILKNKKINYLILNMEILDNEKILKKILKNTKVILIVNKINNYLNILNKNKNIFIILYTNKKYKNIKYDDELLMKKIIEILNNRSEKNIYSEKNFFEINIKNRNIVRKKIIEKTKKFCYNKNEDFCDDINHIFLIAGEKNVGKSCVTICLAKAIKNKLNQKVLIIDSDFLNQNIYSILKKRKFSKIIYKKLMINNDLKLKDKKILNKKTRKYYIKNPPKILNDFLIKIEKNLDLISGLDVLFLKNEIDDEKKNKFVKLDLLKEAKKYYNYIFLDLGTKESANNFNNIIESDVKNIIVIKPDILGIKQFLEDESKDYKTKKGLHIIANLYDNKSINICVIKKCLGGKVKISKLKRFRIKDKKIFLYKMTKECKKIINKL